MDVLFRMRHQDVILVPNWKLDGHQLKVPTVFLRIGFQDLLLGLVVSCPFGQGSSLKKSGSLGNHQEFQVRKMEVLNLIRLFWGWVFPYISLTYSSF